MSTREELEVIIEADGRVKVHVRGIKGKGCLVHEKTMEEVGRVIERELTGEYYEQPVHTDEKRTVKDRRR